MKTVTVIGRLPTALPPLPPWSPPRRGQVRGPESLATARSTGFSWADDAVFHQARRRVRGDGPPCLHVDVARLAAEPVRRYQLAGARGGHVAKLSLAVTP